MLGERGPEGRLQPGTAHVVSAAKALGGPVTVLLAGQELGPAAEAAAGLEGVGKVLTAEDPCLERGLAEPTAALLAAVQKR